MKRNENIKKTEDRSRKTGVGRENQKSGSGKSEGKNAGMKRKIKTVPGVKQPATIKRNSTVFHNKRSNRVIIDFTYEKLAIRACDLLRFFNN